MDRELGEEYIEQTMDPTIMVDHTSSITVKNEMTNLHHHGQRNHTQHSHHHPNHIQSNQSESEAW